jgi:hypothetical protein
MRFPKSEADQQHDELVEAIESTRAFESHATRSQYAVPGELDIAIEYLLEVYKLMYGEDYDEK